MNNKERSVAQVITSIMDGPLLTFPQRNTEGKLLALMALGNPSFLVAQLDICVTARMDELQTVLSSTSLTQAKYQGIALTNLACRTAAEKGVDDATIKSVSSSFSQRYATMTDPAGQWEVARELLLRLSKEIRDHRLANCCSAVRECCEFIDQHFVSSISLDELSRHCGLSPHYISDLFRIELGLGALQYAHQVKMQHAKFLLEYSSLGISAIASMLSYPSHSNFSQRFKKTYDVTPQEYRTLFSKK